MNNFKAINLFTGFSSMKSLLTLINVSVFFFLLSGCDINDEKSRVPVPIPSVPTSVNVTPAIDDVTVSWGAINYVDEYAVYRCPINVTNRQCETTAVADCGSAIARTGSLSYIDTALSNSEVFCYGVQACSEGGCSEISAQQLGYKLPENSLTLVLSGSKTAVESQRVGLHALTKKTTGQVTYTWLQVSGTSVVLNESDTADMNFISPAVTAAELLTFQIDVTDDNGTVSKIKTVTINPDSVFVDAGNDRNVPAGQQVSLHGQGSGAGAQSNYSWSQVAGTAITLSDENIANPIFTTPSNNLGSVLEFELSFFDGIATAKDSVIITVPSAVPDAHPHSPLSVVGAQQAQPLTVVAAPQIHVVGAVTQKLAALAIGGEGKYSWSWVLTSTTPGSSPAAVITGSSTAQVISINVPAVPAETEYIFTVTVTDEKSSTASHTSTIVAEASASPRSLSVFAPPVVVDEGPIEAQISALAIGGTAPYSYSWTQVGLPLVTLRDENSSIARFDTPAIDANTAFVFNVQVTDAVNATVSQQVNVIERDVIVATPLQKLRLQALPVIDVLAGTSVTLAVSATGGDNNYIWSWVQATGSAASIADGNNHTATITTPVLSSAETLTFDVTVTDGNNDNISETVTINVLPVLPVVALSLAHTPEQHVDEGQVDATLTTVAQGGTGNYSYNWVYVKDTLGPDITLIDSSSEVARFNAPAVDGKTLVRFDVTVNDGVGTATQTLYVVINDLVDTLSLAHLQEQHVYSGDTVYLNGSSAYGGLAPYTTSWLQTAGSPSVTLNNITTMNPDFVAPTVTNRSSFSFSYTVTDAIGNQTVVSEDVIVDPVVTPLKASLNGPASANSGGDITLNAHIAGGVPTYTLSYSSTGASLVIDAVTNPTITLPAVTADTTTTITLLIHDSATPEKTVSVNHLIQIIAPAPSNSLPAGVAVQCGDPTTNTPCSLMQLVLTDSATSACPPDKPYSMNDIYQHGSDVAQYKRCVNRTVCDEQWFQATSDKPLCLNFDPNIPADLNCHMCCYAAPGEEACNKHDVPPANTWYRP